MRNWRTNLVLFCIFICWAAIFGRLVFLSVVHHQFYKALAEGQQKVFEPTIGERGRIFFANREPLATNKKGRYVFISPKEIKDKEMVADVLSQILNLDRDWVLEKVKKPNLYEPIKHRLSETEEELLREKSLHGVYIEDEIFRYYPQKNLTSHITGFLGGEGIGLYGLEGFYDDTLRGKEILAEKQRMGFDYLEPQQLKQGRGRDIFVTIDYNIQFTAQNLLSQFQKTLEFESGQIIVIDPVSGKIFALCSVPNFDPNAYSEENPEVFQNSTLQKIFEPGSIFKPITMAGALAEGRITPQTTYVDTGSIEVGGWTIYNYDQRVWGQRTMTEVLERSINTGAIFAERQLGHELFLRYIEKFGFFEETNIDLQGEIFSENKEFKKGYEVNFANASFGQGIEITPMQLVMAYSAIANGGKLITPYIVEENQLKKETREVISSHTSSQLTAMLVSVIENGFGKKAKIEGYFIAGKTGTAQVSWPALGIQKSGYSEKTWQSFIGFAPAFNPKFLILVKLDNPKTKTAEYSAMPIFRELAKYIIDYWQIPPDYE